MSNERPLQKYNPALLVLGSILVLAGLYTWQSVTKQHRQEQQKLPAVQALTVSETQRPFTDLAGTAIALDQYFGQVLVVNSWASWSPFSATELPIWVEVAERYPEDQVRIIAINRGEDMVTAERFLKSVGAAGKVTLILDPEDHFYESIGGYAMPETVVYRADGTVSAQQHGPLTAEQATAYIDAALQVTDR